MEVNNVLKNRMYYAHTKENEPPEKWQPLEDHLEAVAEQWAEKMVNLMVVFLLQTLIFPLLMLWGLLSFAKSMLLQFRPTVYIEKAP